MERRSAHIASYNFGRARKAAAKVACPTLVAFADDDRLIQPAISEELASSIVDARPVRYSSGGHNIQKVQARDLAEKILGLCVGA